MAERQDFRGDIERVAGLGLYWSWVYLSFNQQLFLPDALARPETVMAIHIASCVSAGLAFFGTLVFRKRLVEANKRRALAIGVVACVIGTMLYAVFPFSGEYGVCLAGAIISGVGASTLVLAWGDRFSALSQRRAVICTACSHGLAFALFAIAVAIGSIAVVASMLLAPIASGALALHDRGTQATRRPSDTEEGLFGQPPILSRPFAIGLCIVAFAYGGIRAFVLSPANTSAAFPVFFISAGGIAALLLLTAGIAKHENGVSLSSGYRTALPIIVLSCAVLLFLGNEGIRWAWVLNASATSMVEMITWIVLIDVCRSSRFEPIAVFAAGRALVHAGMALGELSGWHFVSHDMIAQFCVVLIVVLTFATGLLSSARDGSLWFDPPTKDELSAGRRKEPSGEDEGGLESALVLAAERYGLSPREKEVFLLWARGYGSKYVQDKLCISASTVKTHVRHVYGKMGVQNRAELMLLIEQE